MALNPKRVVLPNGITVLAKSNHTSPTVSLLVAVRTDKRRWRLTSLPPIESCPPARDRATVTAQAAGSGRVRRPLTGS